MNKAQNNTEATANTETFEAFTYRTAKNESGQEVPCGYRIVAIPVGGEADRQPARARIVLVKLTIDPDTGEVLGEKRVDTLRDPDTGRDYPELNWVAAGLKDAAHGRTLRPLDTAIAAQWSKELTENYGLPKKAQRPVAIRTILERLTGSESEYPMPVEMAVAQMRIAYPWLAGFVNNDGSYRPPARFDESIKAELTAYCEANDIDVAKGSKVETIRELCRAHVEESEKAFDAMLPGSDDE